MHYMFNSLNALKAESQNFLELRFMKTLFLVKPGFQNCSNHNSMTPKKKNNFQNTILLSSLTFVI